MSTINKYLAATCVSISILLIPTWHFASSRDEKISQDIEEYRDVIEKYYIYGGHLPKVKISEIEGISLDELIERVISSPNKDSCTSDSCIDITVMCPDDHDGPVCRYVTAEIERVGGIKVTDRDDEIFAVLVSESELSFQPVFKAMKGGKEIARYSFPRYPARSSEGRHVLLRGPAGILKISNAIKADAGKK
ncbi:hypothetical protein EDD52_1532 [Primorskyibacter sedentarius]|uniref:Uncharacterized protein n=1 Tax=Primorskyibacter sedentarius TaxID=745311 RepID=A0A4R3IJN0_9RHOB|nr:hypothetical protein [Primorskyibacter sedentarius]TCS48955.1 hypothetical protein EDD52_1532 [Primorskyibacter sedentarius]